MFAGLKKFWKPIVGCGHKDDDGDSGGGSRDNNAGAGASSSSSRRRLSDEEDHPLLWSRDLEKHFIGDFSFAVFQANLELEDRSQVEIGRNATFVGVYDGHGGPDASQFISEHFFPNFIKVAEKKATISEEVIENAFASTEEGFITLVERTRDLKPLMPAIGSCCLVGVISRGILYVANLGDSRAVMGSLDPSNNIVAEQLTDEHNVSRQEIRDELMNMHPDDPTIIQMKNGAWRIKGIIQVSRSIGDAYLKRPDMAMPPSYPRFYVPDPIRRAVLSAEPSIISRELTPNDQFLIFASDGLWEHFDNEEVVNLVHKSPRMGIAKRLVNKALKKAARRVNVTKGGRKINDDTTRYKELTTMAKGERRKYHDDITVVVIFLGHGLQNEGTSQPTSQLSVHGFADSFVTSKFNTLEQTKAEGKRPCTS